MTETSISRERAKRILSTLDRLDLYSPGGDYYLLTTDDGCEHLTEWGQEEPLAQNTGTLSWLSN